jgi:hypothetical protein
VEIPAGTFLRTVQLGARGEIVESLSAPDLSFSPPPSLPGSGERRAGDRTPVRGLVSPIASLDHFTSIGRRTPDVRAEPPGLVTSEAEEPEKVCVQPWSLQWSC